MALRAELLVFRARAWAAERAKCREVGDEKAIPSLALNQAFFTELAKRARDRFAGSPELEGEILASPVEENLDAGASAGSVVLSKLREEESEPRCDIAKGERFRDVDEMPKPLTELMDDSVGNVGSVAVECFEFRPGHEEQAGLDVSHCRCRVRTAIDQWKLSHDSAWSFAMQNLLTS